MERPDPIEEADHVPGAGEETWQESYALGWLDPVSRVGGWQHFGFQRPRGIVDVVSWISVDGKMVHNWQDPFQPIPPGEIRDMTLGPFKLKVLEPLATQQVTFAEKDVKADLKLNAFTGPFWFGHHDAKSHWESFNHITGSIDVGGERRDINGMAFLNRTWGPRDVAKIITFRIIFACFGPDLTLRLFSITTAEGQKTYGFAATEGRLIPVRRFEVTAMMTDDGVTPTGCEATAWTDEGYGYRLTGRVDASAPSAPAPNFLYSHSNMVWTAGERMGAGYFEVSELRAPAPWHAETLGLKAKA